MFEPKRELFPSNSLQRLSSPEKLDQLLRVVKPQNWLSLLSVGMAIGVTAIWSIYGRIPVTVEGKGVLIYPRQVVPVESTSAGQLLSLNVQVGDVVKKGQVLATLDQTELQKQLQQQRAKLTELEAQNLAASSLQGKGSLQEIQTIRLQRQNNRQRIQELQALTPVLRKTSLESIQKQRKQIQQRIAELEELAPILKQKSLESLGKQRQSLQQQIVNRGTRFGSINEETASSRLVGITYLSIADGKKVQPGMNLQITPKTVKRERFGGIVGTVTSISPFPVTKEAAISVVGNPEVVEGLVSQKPDGMMEIVADLVANPSTASRYQWSSSQGPQMQISPGTTTVVRIKVEERAPITYVFPILRSISGIY
ncbi:NHLP bacteriocin system secretion protein [Coleofasciculus sp. F4-SAH-05]|uniref:NHLP bacteriocin system secretion protein n=1 Tax=Coleofasciculus sp. F4-SAH-05 TaxID=3069525 RepID=UPI0032FFDFF6